MPGRVEPIKGAEAQRVCTLTGVQGKIATQKLVELEDLEKMLLTSIAEAEVAAADEIFWKRAEVAARTVKIFCDVFIDVASSLDRTGIAGKAVDLVYDRAVLIVDGYNGKIDAAKIGQQIGETHVDAIAATAEATGNMKLAKVIEGSKMLIVNGKELIELVSDSRGSAGVGTTSAIQSCKAQLARIRVQASRLRKELAACSSL